MAVDKEKITELAIAMHEKNAAMQQLHQMRQQSQAGTWTARSEAMYQVA
jgi:hypothetical protein